MPGGQVLFPQSLTALVQMNIAATNRQTHKTARTHSTLFTFISLPSQHKHNPVPR